MFTVLIADDEPVIINGLINMLDWNQLECQVAGVANDGAEAEALLEALEPDIAVFDINMPGLTGIELIQKISREDLKTKVIFVSGYQEFSYAQEALKNGAVEYLLKPVKKDALEQAILRAKSIIKNQDPFQMIRESKTQMQEIFADINQDDEYAEEELYGRIKDLELDFEDKLFTGACFAIESSERRSLENSTSERFELVRFSVYNRIQEYYTTNKCGFVIKRDDNRCNIMLLFPQADSSCMVDKYIQPVIQLVKESMDVQIYAGIGQTIPSVSELKFAYKTAEFAFEMHFFEDRNMILYQDINKEYVNSFDDYEQEFEKIVKGVLANDSIEASLENCLTVIGNLHYGNKYAVINRCFNFITDFYKEMDDYHLIDRDYRKELDGLMLHLRNLDSYSEVKEAIHKKITGEVEEIFKEIGNKDKLIVAQMKDYIKENYMRNVTLSSMAEQFFMNSFYLSAFFKRETGQNFKEYLTEIRMKEAIKLVIDSELKTYEIAEEVGYNNVRQFTDKFRDIYGLSPSEYKKQKLN